MNNAQVFRPWSGIALAAIVFVICGLLIAVDYANPSTWAWSAVACVATWLVFVRPKLIVADEGVTVVNPFSTTTLGWDSIDAIEVKYALTFYVAGRKLSAWVATAPGRYHGRTIHRSELRGVGISKEAIDAGNIRPGESPRTASGQAIAICRLRWFGYLEALDNGQERTTVAGSAKFNLLGAGALVIAIVAGLAANYLG